MPFYIAIIDYEMGNLKSVYKCLKHVGVEAIITDEHEKILNADGVILPGVGAFGDAIKHLNEKKLTPIIHKVVANGTPLFGICLGLQLLFSKSHEMGEHEGLGLIEGEVKQFDPGHVGKVPQIGWNSVEFLIPDHFLITGIPNNSFYYFVHSFFCEAKNKQDILGQTRYGDVTYTSIISKNNIVATQFHPEKSSKYGIKMYRNFVNYIRS